MDEKKQKISRKDMAYWAVKFIMTFVTIGMLIMFFTNDKMYKLSGEGSKIAVGRIVIVLLLAAIEITMIYIKNNLSDKINMIITIIFSGGSILGLYALLEYSQGFEVFRLSFFDLKYNLFIIFTLLFLCYVITNSFRFSVLISSIAVCALGLGNYYLIQFRGTGLLISDLYNVGTAMNVADNYSYVLNYHCFILVFVTIMICTACVKLKRFTPFPKIKRLIPLVCGIAVIGVFFSKLILSDQYDKTWKIKMFKPQVTYEKHGSMLIFVHSFRYTLIDKPEDYSVGKVKEIAKNYEGITGTAEKQPNIIVIMDEAFSDLSAIGEVELSEDCMPFFHSMKENTIKGNLFVSVCAGGTANTEFEVLTSNTLAFAPDMSSPYQIYINDPMPSLATTLKEQDYQGIIAMHPYKGNGYKRDKVYPLLGFNKFLTRDDFENPKLIRNLISDEEDFNRIISEYDNYKKSSDAPFFMFNVTMQNHSSYDKDFDNVRKDITLSGVNTSKKAVRYVNLIKHTDDALKELIGHFEEEKEPTIIVFFGDHQARLGTSFYNKLLKTSPLDEEYKDLRNYFIPFFIWANYDIKEEENVWTSANYLSSMILDTAGISKTGYQQYVSEVQEEVPVITQFGYIGKDGKFYKNDDKNSPYYSKLKEYQLLEYNNLFDPENRIDNFFDVK